MSDMTIGAPRQALGSTPAWRRPAPPFRPATGRWRAEPPPGDLTIALCVPLGGTAGIWGPSAMASARLAVAELNRGSGLAGRACRLVIVDAADDAPEIEATLAGLVGAGEVDALIGMHTSAVRHRILGAVGGRLPFVYTPLYEGGEVTPDVFAIGETTARQLQPAIAWLGASQRLKRWFAIGNDYVWPRVSHRMARRFIADAGAELVDEAFVPFNCADYGPVLDRLRRARPDAVLLSLVGQDAVDFNRAFGSAGLDRSVLRFSAAIGENELLGIGADNADNLYVACGYFATLATDANLAFKERYRDHFGERAPTLNTFGQSTYEGVHFLAALLGAATEGQRLGASPFRYPSARDGAYAGHGVDHVPIYLAQAEGNAFRVITRL